MGDRLQCPQLGKAAMAISTILIAVAMQDGDERIAARAVQLANQHGAQLVAVHVIEDFPNDDGHLPASLDAAALARMIAKQRTGHLETLLNAAKVPPSLIVEAGKPHAVIERLAATYKADLLVIGPGIAKNLRERVFGSTADRVIRSAPCPILVVRSTSPAPYRHIAIGVDFSEYAKAAARHAAHLVPDASRELLHTVEIPLGFEQAMLKAGTPQAEIEHYRKAKVRAARTELIQLYGDAGRLPKGTRIKVQYGDAAAALLRASWQRGTDLIAVGTQGANAVSQHLLGSVARKVLSGARCDVLVIPASALCRRDESAALDE